MLDHPLSRLDREHRLALVGLKSWGDPALLGVETKVWEGWEVSEVWDCLLELVGWKELCLAASLYSGRGSVWTVEPPEPP